MRPGPRPARPRDPLGKTKTSAYQDPYSREWGRVRPRVGGALREVSSSTGRRRPASHHVDAQIVGPHGAMADKEQTREDLDRVHGHIEHDRERLAELARDWPADVREHALQLAFG